jgi:RNA polymerase sigma-70 factor, ECF subfamily
LRQVGRPATRPRLLEPAAEENPADLVTKTARDPRALPLSRVEVAEMREAIMRLPLKFREIILLREYGEFSYEEIAALLDCPPGTVLSRMVTARSKLRILLPSTGRSPLSPEKNDV